MHDMNHKYLVIERGSDDKYFIIHKWPMKTWRDMGKEWSHIWKIEGTFMTYHVRSNDDFADEYITKLIVRYYKGIGVINVNLGDVS